MNENPFLPISYSVPSSGGRYFKLQPGDNRVRILDSPVMGYQYWTVDGGGKRTPVRRPMGYTFTTDELELGDGEPAKHFWAMPVWSPRDKAVMVWEVTQKGIQGKIKDLASQEDWGNPRGYDLSVTKKGSGMETEYNVVPVPPKPLAPEAAEAWSSVQYAGFDLNELFTGGDPFSAVTKVDDVQIEEIPYYGEEEGQ